MEIKTESHLYLHVFAALLPRGLLLFSLAQHAFCSFLCLLQGPELKSKRRAVARTFFGVLTSKCNTLKPCSAAEEQQEGDLGS